MTAAEREKFQFLAYQWDVTAALDLAAARPVRHTATQPLAAALPLIRIDPEHAAHADLNRPLLLVTVAELDHSVLLIDGRHRLHRALREGHDRLPCRLLDEHHERQVRIRGPRTARPHRPH
ncbi:hypothetical protein V2W30_41325 (plasmid) [Streptomyces sp. Q6]|uniref:Uncharacterized protein n=1 Tax=Streptomyces citrinus TaxID=3118173 RepID=A0ACD5AQW6_9ACTN